MINRSPFFERYIGSILPYLASRHASVLLSFLINTKLSSHTVSFFNHSCNKFSSLVIINRLPFLLRYIGGIMLHLASRHAIVLLSPLITTKLSLSYVPLGINFTLRPGVHTFVDMS